MKTAIIKLGSRISISNVGTSGGTGEALSIIKILVNGGADVDVYTKVLKKDFMPLDFNIYDLESNYQEINNRNYDCLLVLNGNVNYFGGQDDPAQTLNYFIINHFNNRVFYILCDCNLSLSQIWNQIESKSWASNYNKSDIYINRDDIIYISQAQDTKKVLEKARSKVSVDNCFYFPFEQFPLFTLRYSDFNENPIYDISYGGTFRGGKREADMIKFYFGYPEDIKVEMFGKIQLSNFNKKKIEYLNQPIFNKSVNYNEYSNKMLEARSTIIIGDPLYKEWSDLAQRIYESIMIGNVCFIDKTYDFNQRVFSNKELKEFCYISDKKSEIVDKIKKIRDNNFRKYIIDLQREDTKINFYNYSKDLIELIEENI